MATRTGFSWECDFICGLEREKEDYTRDLEKPLTGLRLPLNGIRVGLPREFFAEGLNNEVAASVEAAVTELLECFRRDRNWNEQAARKQLVQLFDAWGPKDAATLDGRRRLSSLLFS